MADTGAKAPTACSGDWTNGSNAYANDGNVASETTVGQTESYTTFTFGVPAGATINGIAVSMEAQALGAMWINGDYARVAVDMYCTDDASWSYKRYNNWTVEAGFSVQSFGGATDVWGRTWVATDFSDANFICRLSLYALTGGATGIEVDYFTVTVYYTAAAGGDSLTYTTRIALTGCGV